MNEIQNTERHGGGHLVLTPRQLAAFYAKVAPRTSPDGCEEWARARMPGTHPYGVLSINGRTAYAHRISFLIHHGPIPDGKRVCHRCDNPPCVRASHLFAGTAKDNSVDMRDKGRWGNRTFPGSSNGFATLNEAKVRAIRLAYSGGARQVDLAARFGITQACISLIVRHKTWRHIGAPEIARYTAIAEQYAESADA